MPPFQGIPSSSSNCEIATDEETDLSIIQFNSPDTLAVERLGWINLDSSIDNWVVLHSEGQAPSSFPQESNQLPSVNIPQLDFQQTFARCSRSRESLSQKEHNAISEGFDIVMETTPGGTDPETSETTPKGSISKITPKTFNWDNMTPSQYRKRKYTAKRDAKRQAGRRSGHLDPKTAEHASLVRRFGACRLCKLSKTTVKQQKTLVLCHCV